MAFNYRFRPKENQLKTRINNFIRYNNKQKKLAVISIILIISIFIVGNNISGYVAHQKNLIETLNVTQQKLDNVTAENRACQSKLSTKSEELNNCVSSKSKTETDLEVCNTEKNKIQQYADILNNQTIELQNEKQEIENNYNNLSEQYKNLIVNSAIECCSWNDILKGNEKQWNIEDNKIICSASGEYKINCSTGETNY